MFADVIDIIFSVALFVNASLFIPQITKILKTKQTNSLSLLTFGGFNLIQLAALLYGVVHKDYVMIVGYFISLLTCGTVTLLIVLGKLGVFGCDEAVNLDKTLGFRNAK